MDIKGHKFGGAFRVEASSHERGIILSAIAELGIQGIDPRELSRNPQLSSDIVGTVATQTQWERQILEAVDITLSTPSTLQDAKELAGRAILRQQTSDALQNFPRR